MKISTGPNYVDFESIVDLLDVTLTLDGVFYISDGSNVNRAWAILASGEIAIISSDFSVPPTNSEFTTDFSSAVSIGHNLDIS